MRSYFLLLCAFLVNMLEGYVPYIRCYATATATEKNCVITKKFIIHDCMRENHNKIVVANSLFVRQKMESNQRDTKINEKKEILKGIKDGTLERFTFTTGHSFAWKKFVKIRIAENKKLCNFVQCTECKALLYFKEGSGTSHLNRHKCNDNETEGPAFKILASDTIASIKESVMRNTLKYCATDFIPIDMTSGPGFKSFLQSFVILASKYGNINVEDVYPSTSAIDHYINNLKDGGLRKVLEDFRSVRNECCSASLEIIGSGQSHQLVVTMSLHYFDKNFVLAKKIIFTTIIDERKSEDVVHKIVHNFNVFGGEEDDLHRINIVTPNTDLFKQGLEFPFRRVDCVAYKINQILDESFEQSPSNDFEEIFSNCRKIVRLIESKDVRSFNIVRQEDGTWKGKVLMLQSVVEQYDNIMEFLENEHKPSIKFIKRRAEELLLFLEPFIEAVSDLSESSFPTANKIILWWATLRDHLKSSDGYSLELKKIVINARQSIATNFQPTMDDKINCFLDPRYKFLKMLSSAERADVILAVQNLLKTVKCDANDEIAEPSGQAPPKKKSKPSDYESSQSDVNQYRLLQKPKPKDKVDRFKKYETNSSDGTENDECDIYLKLPPTKSNDFESEADVIKSFWKSQSKKLPKLFELVKARLHLPACCNGTGIQLNSKLDLKSLDNYMFIRSSMHDEDFW